MGRIMRGRPRCLRGADIRLVRVTKSPVRDAQKELARVGLRDTVGPAEILVEVVHRGAFDEYRHKSGKEVTGDRTLVSRAADWWPAWRQLFFYERVELASAAAAAAAATASPARGPAAAPT